MKATPNRYERTMTQYTGSFAEISAKIRADFEARDARFKADLESLSPRRAEAEYIPEFAKEQIATTNAKIKTRRRRHGWKGWISLAGCLCMVVAFVALAMTTDFTTMLVARSAAIFSHSDTNGKARSAKSEPTRMGTVVVQTGENRCEVRKFDNASGKMILEKIKQCQVPLPFDAHGAPLPTQSTGRLDAIGNSFGRAR